MNLYKQFNLDPPDPTEPEVICKDYKSDDLYFGDECFATEDGYVLVEDVYETWNNGLERLSPLNEKRRSKNEI